MSILGKKCPNCGAFALGRQRFCGSCGCDLFAWETQNNAPNIENISPVRMKETEWKDETPRPTETARNVKKEPSLPTETVKITKPESSTPTETVRNVKKEAAAPTETVRSKNKEAAASTKSVQRAKKESSAPTETVRNVRIEPTDPTEEENTPFWKRMDKKQLIEILCAVAAGIIILIAAIAIIVRMTQPAAPKVSDETESLSTVHTIEAGSEHTLTPSPSPTPTVTPVPTAPPAASTLTPAATPGAVISEVSGYVYALADGLEVLSGPGRQYDVIATVEWGQKLLRTGVLDGWTRVEIDGREGYVPHDGITMEEPEPTPLPVLDFEVDDTDDTVVIDSGANLRIGPGSEYPVYDYAGAGQEFHRTGTIYGWSQVEYDGRKVYVWNDLLRSDSEEEETEDSNGGEEPTPTPAPAPAESYSGTVTLRMNANVRTGPGTEYDVIGLADGGSTLEASELVNGWYKVSFMGQTGYVLASLTE